MVQGTCKLCGDETTLLESHIIPKFAFRWLKKRSGSNGFIRNTENPNRRVQDGLKEYWLCKNCEQRFGSRETRFATDIFYPFCDGSVGLRHGPELQYFATSVSWRVLKYAHGRNPNAPYTPLQLDRLQNAEKVWREFLLGRRRSLGAFSQHILPFSLISRTSILDLPSNINRFLAGAITLDIVGSNRMCMTFAKLGPFVILGHIQARKSEWKGSRVWAESGIIPSPEYVLPGAFLPLLREKAALITDAWDNLSDCQQNKISERIMEAGESFFDSQQGEAILADLEMFGPEAVKFKE